MKNESKPQFNAKVTPEQVNEAIKKDEKKKKSKQKTSPQKSENPAETVKSDAEEVKKACEAKVKPVEFPVNARINDYGFLYFKVDLLTTLGWGQGMAVKIERNSDGSITIRKV